MLVDNTLNACLVVIVVLVVVLFHLCERAHSVLYGLALGQTGFW